MKEKRINKKKKKEPDVGHFIFTCNTFINTENEREMSKRFVFNFEDSLTEFIEKINFMDFAEMHQEVRNVYHIKMKSIDKQKDEFTQVYFSATNHEWWNYMVEIISENEEHFLDIMARIVIAFIMMDIKIVPIEELEVSMELDLSKTKK